MVTDHQVRLLMKHVKKGKKLSVAAAKAGMDPKTARKYLKSGQVPSEMEPTHTWRTREDPFSDIWEDARAFLKVNQGTDAKSLFNLFNNILRKLPNSWFIFALDHNTQQRFGP